MQDLAGFVDLQINGYAGVDFNSDSLTIEDMHRACTALRDDCVAGVLATIITDQVDRMESRLRRIAELRQQDELVRDVVWGVHIEGPFISRRSGFVGAHPADAVTPANIDIAKRLLDAADGLTRIVTLAPECDEAMRTTRWLADRSIVVAAGHSDATLDELRAAIDAGLSMFTHLGNGCPTEFDRHDNIVQRVLNLSDQLTVSFIADGAHVPYFALRNYLNTVGFDRSVIITDAISAAGQGPGVYRLGDQEIRVGEDLVPRAANGKNLAGSAATMPRMYDALRDRVGLSAEQLRKLFVENPRRVLGLPPSPT